MAAGTRTRTPKKPKTLAQLRAEIADLQKQVGETKEQEAARVAAELAKLSTLTLQEIVAHAVATVPASEAKSGRRVGHDLWSIPVTVDGVAYKVNVACKDVAASAALAAKTAK